MRVLCCFFGVCALVGLGVVRASNHHQYIPSHPSLSHPLLTSPCPPASAAAASAAAAAAATDDDAAEPEPADAADATDEAEDSTAR